MKDQRREADRLRHLLDRAAPSDRDAAGRADAVQERARQAKRRNGFAGSVVIALVALTVIVAPHFISMSPTTNENTDPTNGTHQTPAPTQDTSDAVPTVDDAVFDEPCPSSPVNVTDDTLGASMLGVEHAVPIKTGAVLIRICSAVEPGEGESTFFPPPDALIEAGSMRLFYAKLDDGGPWNGACTLSTYDPVNPFAMVVHYADGTTDTFAVRNDWCRGVSYEGRVYQLSQVLYAYMKSMQRQRQRLTDPSYPTVDGLSCAHADRLPAFVDRGPHLHLSAALICQVPDFSRPIGSQQAVSKVAGPGLINAINSYFETDATGRPPTHGCAIDAGDTATYIVGLDRWNEPVFVSSQNYQCAFMFEHSDFIRPHTTFWVPPKEIFDSMTSGLR